MWELLPLHVVLLSLSCLGGWYAGSGPLVATVGRVLGSLYSAASLLSFSRQRGAKLTYITKVLWRLLQLLGPAERESDVLAQLEATSEWNDFVGAVSCGKVGKKTIMLVLDLDETLVHASLERKVLCEPEFLLYDEDYRLHYYVYKRPFVDLFLKLASSLYEMATYTASNQSYSEPILQTIDPSSIITKHLNSSSLVETKLYGMQKDLELVSREHMPSRLVMVDNSDTACQANPENLYVINSYKANQPFDKDLLSLLLLLVAMSDLDDVRSVLHRSRVYTTEKQAGR